MPTAERAWRPRSPSTARNRSEQPLITLGWSVNSGHGVDHAQHLEHLDPGQLAGGHLGRGQQAEADQLGVLVGLLDR